MNNKNYSIVLPEEFDTVFRKEANIAEFKTKEDEENYEKRDQQLIEKIKKTVQTNFGCINDEKIFILEDWWPDHTRHLAISFSECSTAFLSSLQSLLVGYYSDYRIQLVVYNDIMDGATEIGSVVLYANRRLIEQPLYTALIQN